MKSNILFKYFQEIKNLKVAVFGDIMLDTYIFSNTNRISPEGPFPVYKYLDKSTFLGGAANVALNLKKMGANPHLYCVLGEDENSIKFKKICLKEKIQLRHINDKSYKLINKIRLISNNTQITRLDIEDVNKIKKNQLNKFFNELNNSFDGVIFSDYNKNTIFDPVPLIKKCSKLGLKIFIDPKSYNFSKYTGAYCLSPNLIEFENVVGRCSSINDVIRKGKTLIKKLRLKSLLVTLGAKGMIAIEGDNYFYSKSDMVLNADVIGAGDTAISHFVLSSLIENKLELSTNIANLAARISVSKPNTSYASPLDFFLSKGISDKVLNIEYAKLIPKIFKPFKQIVFTNGCFDVIHAGHIKLFEFCKKHGDMLIVGINSDSSVKKLKGKDRPFNNLQNRIEVLSSIVFIDLIIVFEETTPLNLIKKINPNILIKGDDYKIKEIIGYNFVKKNKGIIKTFKFIPGLSSSKFIKKLS